MCQNLSRLAQCVIFGYERCQPFHNFYICDFAGTALFFFTISGRPYLNFCNKYFILPRMWQNLSQVDSILYFGTRGEPHHNLLYMLFLYRTVLFLAWQLTLIIFLSRLWQFKSPRVRTKSQQMLGSRAIIFIKK